MEGITPTSTRRRLKEFALTCAACALIALGVLGVGAVWPAPAVHATETTRTTMTMLNGASALNATGTLAGASIMPACRESVVYIKWGTGTGAGGVTVESADESAYTGTWAPLAVVAWTAASKEDIVQITGIHLNLRTRVSTLVTGGTVSTIFGCN